MSLFNKIDSYLGVDIGAGGIKIVELRKTKGRPQLWTYGILEQPLDIHLEYAKGDVSVTTGTQDTRVASYGALLRHVIDAARANTVHVTASLPVSQVFHAVITLPLVPEKELNHHVLAKVEKMLPHPIADMQVVHQLLPYRKTEPRKDLKVLVTAATKHLVRFYTDVFGAAGIKLEELETEAFAIVRALVGRDTSTAMVVDIGAERTNFFIVDDGVPVTHRSISIGGKSIDTILANTLGIEPSLVSQVKHDLSRGGAIQLGEELFLSAIDPIAKEIQYGFDLFLHQTGNEQKRPEKIILSGGAALFPPILALLRRSFPVQTHVVFVGDPWARVVYQQGLKSILDDIGPRMSVAIGLALHQLTP